MIFRESAHAEVKEFNIYGHRKDLDLVDLHKLVTLAEIGSIAKKKIVPNSIENKILVEIILEEQVEKDERIDTEENYTVQEVVIKKKVLKYEINVLNNEKYEI
jgi:hypothetical protein